MTEGLAITIPSTESLDPRVTAAQLSDSLDSLGVRDRVVDGGVRARSNARIAGTARIVRFEPEPRATAEAYADPNPYDPFIAFMDSVQAGDLIVVATGGDPSTAYWGELFSAAARGKGAVGVVCDSFTRDTTKIEALGFPVFSRGTRPIDYRARMHITGHQVAVDFGGIHLEPGDLIVADADGIVAAPSERIDEVVALANARARTESTVLEELLAGASIGDVWRRHRTL